MSKKEQQKIRSSAIELDSIGEYIPLRDDPKTSYGFLQDDNVPEVDLAAPETVFENRHAKFRKSGIERSFHAGRYLQEASPNEPVKFVTDGDLPNDKADVQLLVDLAGYLTMYGAPIYRVESRIMQVASLLGLEATGFYLPSNIMLSIGDGSKQSPSRTYFLNVPPSNNMSKLERVDRLARNLVKTVSKQYNISDKSKESIAARRKFIEDENLSCPKLIEKLQSYASTPGLYPFPVILLSGAVNCFALSIIFFGANWDESIFSLVLGALTSFLGWIMDNRYSFKHASIVIAFANSFAIRIFQAITGTTSVCHSTVIIVSLFQYLPGFLFAISMFEFGASLPVAGSVRLLLGFIRSCQVGFGAALGSKSAVELLTFINLWQESYNDLGCSDHIENEWWRVFFFVPVEHAN